MRVAVFGATGVVGWTLVQALRSDPDKRVDAVIGLARRLPAVPQPHVDWRRVDLDHDDLDPHLAGVDAVVNVAWERSARSPGSAMGNVARAKRLLDAAARAGVRHVVHLSSFAAYSPVPESHDLVDEQWSTEGLADAPFARAMAALERTLDDFAAAHEVVRLVRIRSGVVLGPQATAQFTGRFGLLAPYVRMPSHLPVLPGVGGASVPAVHHDDLAAAYRLAVTGTGRGPFNVAMDTPLDLDSAARALGARPIAIPASAMSKGADLAGRFFGRRPGWLLMACAAPRLDCSRARRDLGWNPRHTLDDSLRSMLRAA